MDGSAHLVDDRGLIFLFNPNPTPLPGRFRLDRESIGITKGARFEIAQTHPASAARQQANFGEDVSWEVPARSCVVHSVTPVAS